MNRNKYIKYKSKYLQLKGGANKNVDLRQWGQYIPDSGRAIGYFDTKEYNEAGDKDIIIVRNNNNSTFQIMYYPEKDPQTGLHTNQQKINYTFPRNFIRNGYHKKHKYLVNKWVYFKEYGTNMFVKGMIYSIVTIPLNKLDGIDYYNIIGAELPTGILYEKINEENIIEYINPPLNNRPLYGIGTMVQIITHHQNKMHGTILNFYRTNLYAQYKYVINTGSNSNQEENEGSLLPYIPPNTNKNNLNWY
jgi:hypothetical protein